MACLLLLLAFVLAIPAQAQTFPALSGRVVDSAHILTPDVVARIEAKSAEIEQQTGAQLVVATVADLQGYPIEDYGYRLGRAWGIGQKDKNNGVILLVAPNDRRVRVEVGYGLEPVLTDALSSVIIQQQILPQFRAGNMAAGVEAGFDAIATQLALPPEEARKNVAAATAAQNQADQGGIPIDLLIALLFFGLWFFVALRRTRGGKSARRGGPIIIWGPGMGGWGGGGDGGFGGGGFGGGGGGFGGGGASGGW